MKFRHMKWAAAVVAITFGTTVVGSVDAEPRNEPTRVVVTKPGEGPASRRIALGLNKAAVVELPSDASDVLVSNPSIVDAVVRTPRRIFILGQAIGQTNAFFFAEDGKQILNLEIRVERDLVDLDNQIADTVPSSDIETDAVSDNIVLRGTAENVTGVSNARDLAAGFVNDDDKVVNAMTVTGREQVMLKVRVAELQRNVSKQLGVDLSAAWNSGGVPFSIASVNQFSLLGRALSETASYTAGDVTVNNVEGALQAYERAGILRTLAEPNLTAISGEAAKFLAGGEFPVPTARDRDGNVTITYKPFGVGLGFTPVVLDDGRISVRISTEVSELTNEGAFVSEGSTYTDDNGNTVLVSGITIPALRVRRAETTVELPSGGSLVMAGLLQESTKQVLEGLPGAKDIPILGQLFRSRDFQNNETELVVIVTPYLVKPTNELRLAGPTDGFVNPTDLEAIFLGQLNMVYGSGKNAPPEGKLHGPVGFIME